MVDLKKYELWFVTGSQHLYGEQTLREVNRHATEIANFLNEQIDIPVTIRFKSVVKTSSEILHFCREATSAEECIGIVAWMHTFSPAKMWIAGLKVLQKPLLHMHTQYNSEIPWESINMDFMNLNQSAHGGREFGFISTRLSLARKIITGHWKDLEIINKVGLWSRVALGWAESNRLKIARFGDNMREVAVTEGNKVSAQIQFGYSVNGFGTGDLAHEIDAVTDSQVNELIETYEDSYILQQQLLRGGSQRSALVEAARIEVGLRSFLSVRDFGAFTDTFEDLHGLRQLPGLAVQRLMADGYGFGGEGDWKTAALVRIMKTMASGLPGGNSFMEDYTYHFNPLKKMVLGAHMLEICPSIARGQPRCEVHPLSIGSKDDPVRLVFDVASGKAINVSIIELAGRYRMIINSLSVQIPNHPLPNLPVARALWAPDPDLSTAASAWIYAGGAHHTCFSQNLTIEQLVDFAEIAGIECLIIDKDTDLRSFRNEMRTNEIYFHLKNGF
ncbi:UNVERIFIED_CONTAM: hypothetical protein GTU68_028363 [Idotea baltica]|nr:hypothetical protein [Idotea baltica]